MVMGMFLCPILLSTLIERQLKIELLTYRNTSDYWDGWSGGSGLLGRNLDLIGVTAFPFVSICCGNNKNIGLVVGQSADCVTVC